MALTHHTVTRSEAGTELLAYLSSTLEISRKRAKALLDQRSVLVNQRPVWMARHRLKAGDRIAVETGRLGKGAARSAQILYEGPDYLIVNKPVGITTNGTGGLESLLQGQFSSRAVMAVHRLDKDTTGCVIFSRGAKMHRQLIELFRTREITKTYRAIVDGAVKKKEVEIRRRIDGQEALSRIKVIRSGSRASHISVQIATGRTHQIRKHAASIRHPVIGDRQYGRLVEYPDYGIPPRQMLHAYSLRFTCPAAGTVIRIEAPLPGDFKKCLKALV